MSPIAISELALTGNDVIDREHKSWIEFFNKLEEQVLSAEAQNTAELQLQTLSEILEFTSSHFRNEEDMMREGGYPGIVRHHRMHKDFEQKVYESYRNVQNGRIILNSELLSMLRNWFMTHTGNEDIRAFEYMRDHSKLPGSPKILSHNWGRITVEGVGEGKDFKLWPGGGREWDWKEHGTGHMRGIQPADIKELIDNGARVIVLTKGVLSRLRIPDKTRSYIEEKGCKLVMATTKNGVKIYNDYVAKGEAVGGLFHSTC